MPDYCDLCPSEDASLLDLNGDGCLDDADDAEIDACKVEHLISAQARGRLVWFLSSLLSDQEEAQSFLQYFKKSAVNWQDGDLDAAAIGESSFE